MAQFQYQKLFEGGDDETDYRRLDAASEHVSTADLAISIVAGISYRQPRWHGAMIFIKAGPSMDKAFSTFVTRSFQWLGDA